MSNFLAKKGAFRFTKGLCWAREAAGVLFTTQHMLHAKGKPKVLNAENQPVPKFSHHHPLLV